MKKVLLLALLMFPISVFAAYPNLTELTANISGNTISFTGTIENSSTAVMCKLLNENDEEIDMLSIPVDNNSFSGSFTTTSFGNYSVACANYEGGEIKKVSVEQARNYNITLDLNGGEILDLNIPSTLPEGTILDLGKITESEVKPPSGKVFDAYEINGVRYEVDGKYTVNGDITVKLLWKNKSSQSSKTNSSNPKTYDKGIKKSLVIMLVSAFIITISVIKIKKDNKKVK